MCVIRHTHTHTHTPRSRKVEGASGVARVLPTGLVQKGVRVLLFILLVQETWEFFSL